MTALTRDSVDQYARLDVLTVCGGIEVARTEERMQELAGGWPPPPRGGSRASRW